MLQKQTVEPNTLSILNQLMELDTLSSYNLVGGTGLSLLLGHRMSVDLDFFSNEKIENNLIIEELMQVFEDNFVLSSVSKVGVFGFVHQIKVDFVHYPFPILKPIVQQDNIRILSTEDIAAMKIQAILGRSVKKDFFDVSELLRLYSLDEIIAFHKSKYPLQTLHITIPQALIYFEEAEESENPISLNGMTWENVKRYIQNVVNDYLK